MADDCADNILSDVKSCNFICGVVEGFYGRPWTTEQRKDLFQKMKRWGMDSYVYAPKDDYKHRAYWRELYTVEEAEHLTGLISAARAQGVAFYYALSPGLDITYSNQKEVATLKRKLEQVSQFGCTAFALLFDDIEPEMSEADKEIFQSFAHAQVSVTNEVQQHLGGSTVRFLLCPTQYCGTRAMPSVSSSEYLTTLGAKLSKDIDIMWTGPKVISKVLTAACIEEITQVLRRPPVIWDNLHANDYDQKRMFLGPYTGRSPELIPLLRGVLSNPNCEYNANTVPIRTLAHWANCSVDVSTNIDSVAADIKLEKEGGGVEDEGPVTVNKHVYHHRQALRNAVLEWLPEFAIEKSATGPIAKPQPVVNMAAVPILPILPMVNTCMSLTTPTTTTTQGQSAVPTLNTTHLQALADVCTTVSAVENYNPASNPIMNSLVSPTKVVTNESIPNPIGSLITSNISMPSEIPVSTIPVPIMGLNSFQDTENDIVDLKSADKITEAEMLEIASNDHGSENCNVSNMPNITVMSNTQNQMCTVSDCLEVRVSHMEEKDKVLLTNLGDVNHEVDAKVLVNDEDSTADIIVDDCDERLEHKETQNGAMSVGESPCTMSPPHTAESDMECTPENETAVPICQKNIEKSEGIASNLGSPSNDIDIVMADGNENGSMQIEHIGGGEMMMENNDTNDSESDDVLNLDDLMLLCDLFYLPFEHGSQGLKLLQEFNWLKCNAPVLLGSTTKDVKNGGVNKSESQEWHLRARHFASLCGRVSRLSRRLGRCSNQELAHDLCGYVWDLRAVVGLLNAYIKWLALGKFPPNIANFTQGSYTWFSKGWKEAFMSGDQEPWVFRGGLTADLQRLLPIDNGNDLLAYKLPASSTSQLYAIRPYSEEDREQVCSICHRTCRDGMDCTDQFPPELQTLPADRLVGPFLALYPEICMVVEEEEEELQSGVSSARLMGYACAAPDSKVFCRRQEREWVPTMMEKYPHSVLQEWSEHFQDSKFSVPDVVYRHHPAILTVRVLPHCSDPSAPKRLITCLLAALRANGSFGVHVCVNSTDNYMHQFYAKLGFIELTHDTPNNKIYLGRNF